MNLQKKSFNATKLDYLLLLILFFLVYFLVGMFSGDASICEGYNLTEHYIFYNSENITILGK